MALLKQFERLAHVSSEADSDDNVSSPLREIPISAEDGILVESVDAVATASAAAAHTQAEKPADTVTLIHALPSMSDSESSGNEPPFVHALEIVELEPTRHASGYFPLLYSTSGTILIGSGIVTDPRQLSNLSHAFWNLCKGFVGAASFSLPWAVQQTGLIPATLGFVMLALVCRQSMHWVLIAGHYVPGNHTPTYPHIAKAAMGTLGSVLVWFGLFFSMVAACGTYLLFIAGVIHDDFHSIAPWLTPNIALLMILPLPLALALMRSYRFIAKTARFGVAAVMLALVITIVDGALQWGRGALVFKSGNIKWFDMSGFPIFVGNGSFLFVLHTVVLSLEEQMQDRGRFDMSNQMRRALLFSIVAVMIINTLFADFSYICFSGLSPFPDNIVTAIDAGFIQIFTKACLCIDLLFTYAVVMYPFTEALELRLFDPSQFGQTREEWKRNGLRCCLVLCTALLAVCVPHFGYLTGLGGGVGGVTCGFILPPILIWKLAPQRLSAFERPFVWAVFSFGCIMVVLCPTLIIREMIKDEE